MCRNIWLSAHLLAAYAAKPSSWSRKRVVDPESDEMNTILAGGESRLRLSSLCAQMIGPMVLVCRWRAKSENELWYSPCHYQPIGIAFATVCIHLGGLVGILQHSRVKDHISQFHAVIHSVLDSADEVLPYVSFSSYHPKFIPYDWSAHGDALVARDVALLDDASVLCFLRSNQVE